MARIARVVVPGMALHVRQRGHNRNSCFFRDSDYVLYLRLLEHFARQHACAVHAYCLMTNHVHLLVTPSSEDGLARTMKSVAQLYTQQINRERDRTGSLWEGRFRSCLVPTERYVLACYRYVELNPVSAGMVAHARDYRWSSHRVNAEDGRSSLIEPHPAFPGSEAYRGMCGDALDSSIVDDIRRATSVGYAAGSVRRKPGRQMRKLGSVPI